MILGSIITFLACSLVVAIVEVARTRAALHDEQSRAYAAEERLRRTESFRDAVVNVLLVMRSELKIYDNRATDRHIRIGETISSRTGNEQELREEIEFLNGRIEHLKELAKARGDDYSIKSIRDMHGQGFVLRGDGQREWWEHISKIESLAVAAPTTRFLREEAERMGTNEEPQILDWNAAARESAGLGLTTIPIGNSGGSLSFSGEDAEWIIKSALDATKIGDVKLHNCALTPADIEADFEREYGTPCDIRGPNVKSGTIGGSWE
jgi:hypothetical protein